MKHASAAGGPDLPYSATDCALCCAVILWCRSDMHPARPRFPGRLTNKNGPHPRGPWGAAVGPMPVDVILIFSLTDRPLVATIPTHNRRALTSPQRGGCIGGSKVDSIWQ